MSLAKAKPVAQRTPLPCFGISFDLETPDCRACPFKEECVECSGRRGNYISLNQVEFVFLPPGLAKKKDSDETHANRLYLHCFQTVFGHYPNNASIGRLFRAVLDRCSEAGCDLRLYMLAAMTAHRENQDRQVDSGTKDLEREFTPKALASAHLLRDVLLFKRLCQRRYGSFGPAALGNLTGLDVTNELHQRLLASELLAAHFILDWKLTNDGPPWAALYAEHELEFDVDWLSIEPTYRPILQDYLQHKTGSKRQQQLRYEVGRKLGLLQRRNQISASVFQARELIMPIAVARVLEKRSFRVEDFELPNQPVKQALPFWVWLARAIQHWHCLQALQGKPSAFSDFRA